MLSNILSINPYVKIAFIHVALDASRSIPSTTIAPPASPKRQMVQIRTRKGLSGACRPNPERRQNSLPYSSKSVWQYDGEIRQRRIIKIARRNGIPFVVSNTMRASDGTVQQGSHPVDEAKEVKNGETSPAPSIKSSDDPPKRRIRVILRPTKQRGPSPLALYLESNCHNEETAAFADNNTYRREKVILWLKEQGTASSESPKNPSATKAGEAPAASNNQKNRRTRIVIRRRG